MWDGNEVPLIDSGDKALFVTGNVLFDVTLVLFGQVMVAEEAILVQGAEKNELEEAAAAAVVVETVVFVLAPNSVALLLDVL
jgi:hypothetical protein